ncbi:MAG TPA: hypothetical protein VG276_06980 [Actinomycetes bacterium]|nr:hypothetical protein [Actinomycetes bacterium]
MSVPIIVQVRPELAAGLHGQAAAPEARALVRAAESLGAPLRPLHPASPAESGGIGRNAATGTGDPELAAWFTLEVPDQAAAERAVGVLRAVDGVTAAYVKPPAEPP